VRIIVPYAPGGTADVLCRDIASKLTAVFGQQVIVENRAGAAGMIGAEALAKSAPDGYTLGMLATPHAATPFVMKLPFDPAKDLSPVTLVANVPGLLSVNASVPARTLQELLALARANPGKLTYGHPGNLSAGHLAMEMLKDQAKVNIVPVPYKGGGPALMDLLGGQITMTISGPTAHLPHIATGKLRPIATTALHRSSALPEVPTIAESGLPGFELNEWYGLFVPARTPADVIARLNEEIVKVIKSREYTARTASLGAEAVGNSPEAFGAFFRNEMERNGRLIRSLGLKAE
jgi:tripartite-type tricarboxylate transporter receptor subunit TctC